jgi:GNAT superfamily N-acetyltransferase
VSILVRPAKEGDVEAMAKIRARRWGSREFWMDRIGRYLKGEYFPQQALETRAVFVADDDGEVVGLAAGHQTRRFGCDGELEWIDVAEERRRRGVAAQLLASAGSWFVEQNLRRICVNVDPQNAAARGFYAKHGAVALNEHWMVWEDATSMSGSAV